MRNFENKGNLEIHFAHSDDPKFYKPKNERYKYYIIRKILGYKSLCLRCHSLHVINDVKCHYCGAETLRYDSGILDKLILADILSLRVGIPGDTRLKRYYSMIGPLKNELREYHDNYNMNLYIGYKYEKDNFNNFFPVHIGNLEKLFLIGVNLWNILYSKDLGTFIWMERCKNKYQIPIPREFLRDYFIYDFFLQSGHHLQSNKKVLILSRNETHLQTLDNVSSLNKKIRYENKNIDIQHYPSLHSEFESAEWYLFFNLDDNIIIVPQEKSKLDIRTKDELIRIMEIDKISNDRTIKRSLREWDMDDMN